MPIAAKKEKGVRPSNSISAAIPPTVVKLILIGICFLELVGYYY